MKFSVMGSASAAGVPAYGCSCPACRRASVLREHRRRPCSGMVELNGKRWLLDAGVHELADRMPAGSFEGIFLTHYHMDHVQALFGMRWGCDLSIPVIGPDDPVGCDDLFKHPGILDFSRVAMPFQPIDKGDVQIMPLPLAHSRPTLGYVFTQGDTRLAYLTDTCGLPPETEDWLLRHPPTLLVLDCSFAPQDKPPRNHNDLNLALAIVERLSPGHCLLTHIDHRFDAWLMQHDKVLPPQVSLASDGASFVLDDNGITAA